METEKQFDLRLKTAERIHDRDFKAVEMHTKAVETFSMAAMRAPALVAAGGVAASLGFYSANYSRLVDHPQSLQIFNTLLAWLFFGLLLTILAPAFAYFSQLAYTDALYNNDHIYESPYSVRTKRSNIGIKVGDFFRWGCVLIVFFSIVAVSIGGIMFLVLVNSLK